MNKNLPFFYSENLTKANDPITLDEATSKHAVQVLRMKPGEALRITNGKGLAADAIIREANKKGLEVSLSKFSQQEPRAGRRAAIAISPVKNTSRFEWFLEKATELGIAAIYPIICARTERQHFRHDRMNAICISAMLQSQQTWLPQLHQPISFTDLLSQEATGFQNKWIAHCSEMEKKPLTSCLPAAASDSLVLIGPEGDFTEEEVALALDRAFAPVSLGETRLRTETAGVVAATLLTLL